MYIIKLGYCFINQEKGFVSYVQFGLTSYSHFPVSLFLNAPVPFPSSLSVISASKEGIPFQDSSPTPHPKGRRREWGSEGGEGKERDGYLRAVEKGMGVWPKGGSRFKRHTFRFSPPFTRSLSLSPSSSGSETSLGEQRAQPVAAFTAEVTDARGTSLEHRHRRRVGEEELLQVDIVSSSFNRTRSELLKTQTATRWVTKALISDWLQVSYCIFTQPLKVRVTFGNQFEWEALVKIISIEWKCCST